jgi:hypothetical protein
MAKGKPTFKLNLKQVAGKPVSKSRMAKASAVDARVLNKAVGKLSPGQSPSAKSVAKQRRGQ